MSTSVNRRHFLQTAASSSLALSLATGNAIAEPSANDQLLVAVMGTGGRGTEHAVEFAKLPGVKVAYVCDVDPARAANAASAVLKAGGKEPKTVGDFRYILDDRAVDALIVATCNHWHAPAAILACAAGKHVYVEKPCSHNPREGELLVEAARKYKRKVQMGNQRRSMPKVMEAIQFIREGGIGRPTYAMSWYTSQRGSIGKGKEVAVPRGLDYDLWQGPAPRRPFHSNYLHYTWHWFWHWGNGELGNNGVHYLDICRWGLGVEFPEQVSSLGGRYRFDDDQETPDTNLVTFTFPDRKMIAWEGLSCNQTPQGNGNLAPQGKNPDVLFHGDKGSLAIYGGNYTVYDGKGKMVRAGSGGDERDLLHRLNFLEAIRQDVPLAAEIDSGHRSTLLCHLGNIAYRTGRTLHCDPSNGHILHDKEAMALWTREYEKGWEPKV